MSDDKIHVHIDSSKIREDVPQTDYCPKCGTKDLEAGFGLAGGGFGPYMYCGQCGVVVSKSQDTGE